MRIVGATVGRVNPCDTVVHGQSRNVVHRRQWQSAALAWVLSVVGTIPFQIWSNYRVLGADLRKRLRAEEQGHEADLPNSRHSML